VLCFGSVGFVGGRPESGSETFAIAVQHDAAAFLAGAMTTQDFAASVWFLAGSDALRRREDERSAWLEQWIRFAHWDDELDEVFRGRRSEDDRRRIEAALQTEATALALP